jgi:hypothetical protein
VDFLESVITERPRRMNKKFCLYELNFFFILLARIGRRHLTDQVVQSLLYSTPPKHRGSKRFFRNLEDAG